MNTVYIVRGGDLYGTILYGIYTDKKDALNRKEKLVLSAANRKIEDLKLAKSLGTSSPYWDTLTAQKILDEVRLYFEVDTVMLDIDTEIVLYAE